MSATIRSLIQINKTLYVSLPQKWIKLSHLKKGDRITVLYSDGDITIRPYRNVLFIGEDNQIPYGVECEVISDSSKDSICILKWKGITFCAKEEDIITAKRK